jgi:hypothetical protein
VKNLEDSMATASLMDSDLQKFEVALDRLGASSAPKKQRPIVDRERVGLSQKEAVAAAATALAALWQKSRTRSGGGSR